MNGVEALIPIFLFVSIASVIVLRGPLGKALAERISGRVGPGRDLGPDVLGVQAELDQVRSRLTEVEERLDFTERLLAQQRQAGQLEGGKS